MEKYIDLFQQMAKKHGTVHRDIGGSRFAVSYTYDYANNVGRFAYAVNGVHCNGGDFETRLEEVSARLEEVSTPVPRDTTNVVPISPDEAQQLSAALTELHKLIGEPVVYSDTEIVKLAIEVIGLYKENFKQIRDKLGV